MIIGIVILAISGWIAFCGWQWDWGPFSSLHDLKVKGLPGNAVKYDPANVKPLKSSSLMNKQIAFLGSSVTKGAGACGVSFVDYIAKKDSCTVIKEAVSGTTLANAGICAPDSYIQRMLKISKSMKIDLFVCQLSTNDATQGKPLGKISNSFELNSFDTSTVTGAMEYIICYSKQTWHCPVVFYTNTRYNSKEYATMVSRLLELQKKWNIGVIDLWNNEKLNRVSTQQHMLYMSDAIHPTKAGYLEWWTPFIEEKLYEYVK